MTSPPQVSHSLICSLTGNPCPAATSTRATYIKNIFLFNTSDYPIYARLSETTLEKTAIGREKHCRRVTFKG